MTLVCWWELQHSLAGADGGGTYFFDRFGKNSDRGGKKGGLSARVVEYDGSIMHREEKREARQWLLLDGEEGFGWI